jgi:tetratricopeptide (TPR) repeat protein
LSIPDGLIRPAENPFYHLTGPVRIKSYLYTTTLHLYKQLDFDTIGFSHEYGQNCIPPVEFWNDRRLHGTAWLLLLFYILLGKIYRYRLFYLYLAWTATLFPITGIIKVGTFVSDRLVVPSTVPVALAGSIWLFQWLTMSNRHVWRRRALLAIYLLYRYSRIYYRSLEWMDSVPLLQSSLRTCPNFAKGHMELSKVYSSLYPELYDLKKARRHLNRARSIDPNFCDVHQQFAIVAVKENKWMEVEKELFLSIQCPYTMGGAVPMWNDYWTQQLNGPHLSPALRQSNQQRYLDYSEQLKRLGEEQEQAMRAKEQQGNQHARHPFAWKRTSG